MVCAEPPSPLASLFWWRSRVRSYEATPHQSAGFLGSARGPPGDSRGTCCGFDTSSMVSGTQGWARDIKGDRFWSLCGQMSWHNYSRKRMASILSTWPIGLSRPSATAFRKEPWFSISRGSCWRMKGGWIRRRRCSPRNPSSGFTPDHRPRLFVVSDQPFAIPSVARSDW